MEELSSQFEARKREHIALALEERNQSVTGPGLNRVRLLHEALPDLNLEDLSLGITSLGHTWRTPFYVASMTAGHEAGLKLNVTLAKSCARLGWPMGVGSQRRQLFDAEATYEWQQIRSVSPDTVFFGNLGLSQIITTPVDKIKELVQSLDAIAMIVHLNPLQECLQAEGTPQFKGGLDAIRKLCGKLDVPVIVKETGCGMSAQTMQKLCDAGVAAIDVSGLGGTHWGRIEGRRASEESAQSQAAEAFADWGISTAQSLLWAKNLRCEIWGSGGVRSGLDAAKLLALGACRVGFAKPALECALKGEDIFLAWARQMEFELKVALFCTGSQNPEALRGKYHV